MVPVTTPVGEVRPDLAQLEPLRRVRVPGPLRPSGDPPFFDAGEVITWHYGHSLDVLRVVRDDERGLVAWLPRDSERLVPVPRDGRGVRERSLAERAALAVAGDYDLVARRWRGPGLLRIAPTGVPWSLWYFVEDDGAFAGHYINLELVHERPADGGPRIHTRDLTLDLWVEDGQTWLKDADELDAGVAAGWYTRAQAAVIHEIAEQARAELIEPRAWPLDEGWEDWRPPPGGDDPLAIPASIALPS